MTRGTPTCNDDAMFVVGYDKDYSVCFMSVNATHLRDIVESEFHNVRLPSSSDIFFLVFTKIFIVIQVRIPKFDVVSYIYTSYNSKTTFTDVSSFVRVNKSLSVFNH